jgi:hypothetical protein
VEKTEFGEKYKANLDLCSGKESFKLDFAYDRKFDFRYSIKTIANAMGAVLYSHLQLADRTPGSIAKFEKIIRHH